jgi:sugar phosphate isomerase/epimerase
LKTCDGRIGNGFSAVNARFRQGDQQPKLQDVLDTGHCAILGTDIGEAVRLIGKDYLQTLHVHDNNGNNDSHWIPYTGVCNWSDFAKALQEIDFQEACPSKHSFKANP